MEVAKAFLHIGKDEFPISDRYGGLSDILLYVELGSKLSIKWLGNLRIYAIVKEPFMCINDEVEKYIIHLYCDSIGAM